MRLVTTSKFYYRKSDIEEYLFKITDLLRSYRNEVAPFSMKCNKNIKTVYDNFFASAVFEKSFKNKFKQGFMFDKPEAQKKLSELISTVEPDILWNFGMNKELFHYIVLEAKKNNIKLVQTVSDNVVTKEKAEFFSKIINKFVGGFDDEVLKTSINKNFKVYSSQIDIFITPSQFLMKKMIKEGISKEKIVHIPSFISTQKYIPKYDSENYYVYFGELTEQKGVKKLLDVAKKLPKYKLLIIGDGALKNDVRAIIESKELNNVTLLDKVNNSEKEDLVRNARFCINPSQWHENTASSILESYAMGKPVLVSNLGGLCEYVADNYSGLLFQYDSDDELCDKIDYLMSSPSLTKEMGAFARSLAENCYNSEIHYHKISNLLNSTIQSQKQDISFIQKDIGLNIS